MNYKNKLNQILENKQILYKWLIIAYISWESDIDEHNVTYLYKTLKDLNIENTVAIKNNEDPIPYVFGVTNDDFIETLSNFEKSSGSDLIIQSDYHHLTVYIPISSKSEKFEFDPESPRIPDEGDTWGRPQRMVILAFHNCKNLDIFIDTSEEVNYVRKWFMPNYENEKIK